MIRSSVFCLASLWIASPTPAGEVTIETRPFTINQSFAATILPADGCTVLKLEPKSWTEFKIIEIAAHGSSVAKGDLLVRFDPENIDQKLVDARSALAASTLSLAQAELDLKNLEQTSAHRLDATRRAADIAKEENAYFTTTLRKATEESAAQKLERSKQSLENQQEELKQLTQMYEEDDLTEDTEEIILTRQKNAVIAAEFALRMETLSHKRTVEVSLPREAVNLANAERDTAIALAKAISDIPRGIDLKKIEVQDLQTKLQREKENLADLELDRALFEIKAPADGIFYHGSIEDGRWTTGEAVKALVPHGSPGLNRGFATFVPAKSAQALTAFLDEATARTIEPKQSGTATLSGREDLDIPVALNSLAVSPATDGKYRADFSATWPDKFTPVTGSSATIHVITYHQDAAIAIPSKALTYGTKGWSLEVKLADGKTEHRPVKCGRVSGDNTEILSGLEVGQVVITP